MQLHFKVLLIDTSLRRTKRVQRRSPRVHVAMVTRLYTVQAIMPKKKLNITTLY